MMIVQISANCLENMRQEEKQPKKVFNLKRKRGALYTLLEMMEVSELLLGTADNFKRN